MRAWPLTAIKWQVKDIQAENGDSITGELWDMWERGGQGFIYIPLPPPPPTFEETPVYVLAAPPLAMSPSSPRYDFTFLITQLFAVW